MEKGNGEIMEVKFHGSIGSRKTTAIEMVMHTNDDAAQDVRET